MTDAQGGLWKPWEGPQASDRPSENLLCWYTRICPAYTIGLPFKGMKAEERAGREQYLVMIRSVFDPERTPRPKRMADDPDRDRTPHLTMKKTKPEDWHDRILADVTEHGQSTMNAMGVRLTDTTGDMLGGSVFEAALWDLVRSEKLAWTDHAPVFFNLPERIDWVRREWNEKQ